MSDLSFRKQASGLQPMDGARLCPARAARTLNAQRCVEWLLTPTTDAPTRLVEIPVQTLRAPASLRRAPKRRSITAQSRRAPCVPTAAALILTSWGADLCAQKW